MSFDPDAFLAGKPQRTDFDPDAWLRDNNGFDTQSGWKDLANSFITGANEALAGSLEGGMRMVSSMPELVGKAAELYTRANRNLTDEAKAAQLANIAANRPKVRQTLAENSFPGSALVRALDVMGKGADRVQEHRQVVRENLPVDRDFAESTFGGVTSGLGQAAAQVPLYLSGLGLPSAVTQMFDQGYQDAKSHGADEGTAALSGIGNMPSAALEYAADKLQLGPVLDIARKQKVVKAGAEKLAEDVAKTLAGRAKGVAKAGAAEAATEAVQQGLGNLVASSLYDEGRGFTEGMRQAALVGGLTGSAVRGMAEGADMALPARPEHPAGGRPLIDDTGLNIPEPPETLEAQQQQLIRGLRPAMMFPAGTPESLEVPDGFARVETPRGIFHFDPAQVTEENVRRLSARFRENEILAMGKSSTPKSEVFARAAGGDPAVSVAERTANGTEVKGVLGNRSNAAAIAADLEATKLPGSKIAVESPVASIVDRIRADIEAGERAGREQAAREQAAREQRLAQLRAKQEQFDATLTAARALAADPKADHAKLSGALNSLTSYTDDNSLGITQDQRNQALREIARITPRANEARIRREQAEAAAAIEVQAAEKARKAALAERIKADRAAVAAQVKAGIGADGKLDYGLLKESDLEERARNGDEAAGREIMRRSEAMGDDRETLLEALKSVKLPATDAGLGTELDLLREDMTPTQRRSMISREHDSLDRTAEALRGRGFTQIQTPDDVLTFASRAFRGEDIRADRPGGDQLDVSFATKEPNRLKIQPMEHLTPEEREHEDRFTDQLNRATDEENDAAYAALPESQGGRVLNTDIARELYAKFKGAARAWLSQATHRAASRYVRDLFSRTLKKTTPTELPVVRFLAGGGGSGKSTVLKGRSLDGSLTYDTTFSSAKDAIADIDEALQSGRRVLVEYVHRPIEGAVSGAISRAKNVADGRTVPLQTLARAHYGAQQSFLAVAERYRGDPRVTLSTWDNSGVEGSARRVGNPVDFIRSPEVYYDSENTVHERALREFSIQRSSLSAAQRRGFEPNDGRGVSGVRGEELPSRPGGPQPERPGGSGPAAAFAAERAPSPRILTDAEVERQWSGIKSALGPIAKEFDLKVGMVADVLEDEGYAREARLLRQGKLGSIAAATAPRIREDAAQLGPHRQFIVVAATSAKEGKASGLLLHELAHPFYDSLPADTQALLRDLHERETTTRTGPLYEDGKPVSDIAITAAELPAARVRADPDLPVKEWFAERVRRLNEAWLAGEMVAGDKPLIIRLARQLYNQLRRIFAQIRGLDPDSDLFTGTFQAWLQSGTKANIAPDATAYAQRMRAEFATQQGDSDESAPQERLSRSAEGMKHPAAVGDPHPGEAWMAAARMTPEQIREEQQTIARFLSENPDAADIEKANLQGRVAALRTELDRRESGSNGVTPAPVARPKVERKTALLEQWHEGKRLRDEGLRTGNDTAEQQGQTMLNGAKAHLDEEFAGWEDAAYAEHKRRYPVQRNVDLRFDTEDDGRNLPEEPNPEPPENGPAFEDPPPPVRPGVIEGVFGNTQHVPTAGERAKEFIRRTIVGIRGSIPELPAFPALARRTDRFIKEFGDQFYNKLKEFQRALSSGNDYVQRTAEEQVAAITTPLLNLGGKFAASDYRRLQRRQAQLRTLRAKGEPMPGGALAELQALNAKLEEHPYILFNRLVVALDLDWRHRNLRDSAGNPIKLPNGVNGSELAQEIQTLSAKIEASTHKGAIEQALKAHMRLVKTVADDLKSRELLASDHLSNPYYFPHITLQTTQGDKTVERELRPERVRVGTEADFRGYLMDPVGSTKPIETDYVRALYYHLVQVGAHNLKADAVRDYVRPYDIRAQVDETAKQLSKKRGSAVGWEQAFHEVYEPQGYVLYGTDSRDAFPSVQVDRDKLARRLGTVLTSESLHKQIAELGLRGITLQPDDITETLIQGQRETWVVPARVAEALRGIASRQVQSDKPIEAALKAVNSAWKRWKLFMPQNHIRYEYGNVMADLEKLFSASPRTFLHLGRAAREMREFFNGGPPSDELRAALKEGAINAITAQEMQQLQRVRAFEKFQTAGERMAQQLRKRASSAFFQPFTNLLGVGDLSSVELSALREGITRYANFLANLESIKNNARPDYAGAYWQDIEAIQDSQPGAGDRSVRQAAQISKATFGDYGDISVTGQYLRDKLIPFYSWMEVNWKYHANLFRNLRDLVGEGVIGKGAAGKQAGRAIAALLAGRSARVAGAVLMRLALPYAAIAVWNNTGDREELEDELSEEDRRRTHIIVGRSPDGKVSVIYANTALADVMKWFSGAKFMQAMGQWLGGRTDFLTALSSWTAEIPGDLVNQTVGSAGPLAKIAVTAMTGKTTFPDVLDPRTVPAYDLRRNILGQMTDDFTADMLERLVNKDYMASRDLGDWMKQLILQVRQRDPEQWAFYSIRDKAAEFEYEKTGKRDGYADRDAPDQQVLRNFRRAIYQGDPARATQFYLRLLDYGYTAERFAGSIRAQDPLAGLPKKNGMRQSFVESLDSIDREMLDRAYRYASRLTGARGMERALFPRERWGVAGQEAYRAAPKTDVLTGIVHRQAGRSSEDIAHEIERDLERSLGRN